VVPNVKHLEPRNEVLHAFSDHGKVRQRFGPLNPVNLDEGLRRMAAWAKVAGAKESKSFDNIEILEKLPPSWR
jgi:UDP-glucose 4-epimerase